MKKQNYDVIIIGAGFGGLNAAIELGDSDQSVLLIDKTNHHLFQPLLYQVATAALGANDIASPIREIVAKYDNITPLLAEVTKIDRNKNTVTTSEDQEFQFKKLVIAAGSLPSYFGNDHCKEHTTGLKTMEDAVKIREKLLLNYQRAEKSDDPEERESLMTIVIIGGGPTGVELAGAISEIALDILATNFKSINTSQTKVYLIEGGDQLLSGFDKKISDKALNDLKGLNVKVLLNTKVDNIKKHQVSFGEQDIKSQHIIWAAGNKASPLLNCLGVELDQQGRVEVQKDCSLPMASHIYIIGDAAAFPYQGFSNAAGYLPGLAQVAIQQGHFVGKKLKSSKTQQFKEFKYTDKGMMATVGKRKAALQTKILKLYGHTAWLLWSVVHLLFLVKFRNRFFVFMNWIIAYVFKGRGSRLIK